MASKTLPSDDEMSAAAEEKKLTPGGVPVAAAGQAIGGKHAEPPDEPGDDEDDELELEDEDDEDLVVYTAQEAAGALGTIYSFVRPHLGNYKKLLAFVSLGVVIETLFNVIMPLSLKFLIDDALGEEDFQALYRILGVLARSEE